MILVTGATGCLGSALTPLLLEAGQQVRGLSRRERAGSGATWVAGDLESGDGLSFAVRDAEVIVHAASDAKPRSADPRGTGLLLAAARQAGHRPHIVYISIAGIDDHPYGYYRAKLATERVIMDSGLPYTILRTTQWHQLLDRALTVLGRFPVVPVPSGTKVQPLDVCEVAARMAELATGAPAGRVADLGGPQIADCAELARSYLRAAGKRRAVLPVRIPGATGRAFRDGLHLAPEHRQSSLTWEDFLTLRFSRPSHSG